MNMISDWQLWLLLAVAAGIAEVALPYFTFAFVGAAALIALATSFSMGLAGQTIIFGVTLLLTLFFVRPRLLEKLHQNHSMPSRSQELVGAQGEVTETIPASGTGRILVNGQDWAAKSDARIEVGKVAEVKSHDGIVLIVKEI